MSKEALLSVLNQEIMACTKCKDLVYSRTKPVLSSGNIHAELVFVGEAPGKNEDKEGIPFCGRAGKLLNNALASFNISRESIYILNTCRCRPPLNRVPTREEIKNCSSFLETELDILQPKFVVALGTVAAQQLLNTDDNITKLRGKVHNCKSYKLLCFYHPSYIIRNPSNKKLMYDDMKFLVDEMSKEIKKENLLS